MAKLNLDIVNENNRKVTGRKQVVVDLDDDVFSKLNSANQTLIALHDKFIGTVDEVAEYNINNRISYGVTEATLQAISDKFKL